MNKLKTILLVDDYDADNFIHRLVVERYGCAEHIEVSRDGKQAIDYLKSCVANDKPLPELIFLDINMPVMNGWEFLEQFHTLRDSKPGGAVVVMLTTSLNPDDRARAESYPEVRSFTYKPLTESRLDELLKEFYPQARKDE